MGIGERLKAHRGAILKIDERHGAARVRVFGSVARGEEQSRSDVDFLVAFEPGRSLLDQVGLEQDLGELLGCPVDVVAEGGISPYLEGEILAGTRPL